jgi:DNA polymerase III epsilon subunit-like protein
MFTSYDPQAYTKKIIYDLEFSGDLRTNNGIHCCLWQIAAKDFDTGITFCTLVNPYILHQNVPEPVDGRYSMPSREEFMYENAPDIREAMGNLAIFFKLCMTDKYKNVCLMSHNGFRSDKIIFENTLLRYNISQLFNDIPLLFFDTLYYFREIYPGLESYSLANLYMYKFQQEIKDAHDANVDVDILESLLKTSNKNINGAVYLLFYTPFTNVSGVGTYTEQKLLEYGFVSVSHFINSFFNKDQAIEFLQQTELKDRSTLIVDRMFEYIKTEVNQRWPLLRQQQQELMQEKNE